MTTEQALRELVENVKVRMDKVGRELFCSRRLWQDECEKALDSELEALLSPQPQVTPSEPAPSEAPTTEPESDFAFAKTEPAFQKWYSEFAYWDSQEEAYDAWRQVRAEAKLDELWTVQAKVQMLREGGFRTWLRERIAEIERALKPAPSGEGRVR